METLRKAAMLPPVTATDRKPRPGRAKSETSISLRVSTGVLDLITTAAALVGKSRTEFMLESARQQAIDVLLDQRFFHLTEEQYDTFLRVLEEPPPPNEKLKQLLAGKAPWET